MDLQKLLDKIKKEKYSIIAIRRCSPDERYEVGDICRNSYEWNYELEVSSYDTEDPVEMEGTCGYNVSEILNMDDNEKIRSAIMKAIDDTPIYDGNAIIIAGNSYIYGNDENEIIIKNAEVIAKS